MSDEEYVYLPGPSEGYINLPDDPSTITYDIHIKAEDWKQEGIIDYHSPTSEVINIVPPPVCEECGETFPNSGERIVRVVRTEGGETKAWAWHPEHAPAGFFGGDT